MSCWPREGAGPQDPSHEIQITLCLFASYSDGLVWVSVRSQCEAREALKCWTNTVAWWKFVESPSSSRPHAKQCAWGSRVLGGWGCLPDVPLRSVAKGRMLPASARDSIYQRSPKGEQCDLAVHPAREIGLLWKLNIGVLRKSQPTGLGSNQRCPGSLGHPAAAGKASSRPWVDALFSSRACHGNIR